MSCPLHGFHGFRDSTGGAVSVEHDTRVRTLLFLLSVCIISDYNVDDAAKTHFIYVHFSILFISVICIGFLRRGGVWYNRARCTNNRDSFMIL